MTTQALLEAHAPSTDDAVGYPVIGETTVGLGEYLIRERILTDAADYQRVRRDALAIVSHCRRFDEGDGTRTGLVVSDQADVPELVQDFTLAILTLPCGRASRADGVHAPSI